MSWLKSTISKVQEKAEVLKNSQALKQLQERTKRLGKGSSTLSASDMQTELESKARSAKTLPLITDLHKQWLQQLSGKEGSYPSAGDVPRDLSFKEVLLRSTALETSVEVILGDPALRASYLEAAAAEDKDSPIACLDQVLEQLLLGPKDQVIWSGILRWGMSEAAANNEECRAWVLKAITSMKIDWYEEMLLSERKELALRSEYLRQEIRSGSSDASDEAQKSRMAASAALLQTVLAVRKNLAAAKERREEVLSTRGQELSLITEQVNARVVSLKRTAEVSGEEQKKLESDWQRSQDSIQVQLDHMGQTRKSIDHEIEDLEEKKRLLRQELDDVSAKLDDARNRQREQMEKCDKERAQFEATKGNYKQQVEAQELAMKSAEEEHGVVMDMGKLVKEADGLVQDSLKAQLSELDKKQTQFQDHVKDVLHEHLKMERERAKQAIDTFGSAGGGGGGDEAERLKAVTEALDGIKAFNDICDELALPSASDMEAATLELKALQKQLSDIVGASKSSEPASSPAEVAADSTAAGALAATTSSATSTTAAEAPPHQREAQQGGTEQQPLLQGDAGADAASAAGTADVAGAEATAKQDPAT